MRVSLGFTVLCAIAGVARAQTPPPSVPPASEGERPWAKGVSPEEQTLALDLLRDGNTLVGQMLFPNAVDKYREALKHWDHPAIHYNLALALFALGDAVGVHENAVSALKYGEAPLGHDKFVSAQDYLKRSEAMLTHLFVMCDQIGAQVAMDGTELFTGPGKWDGWVKPGRHALNATAEGFVPANDNRELIAGKDVTITLKLLTSAQATTYKRKFPVWKAWTVEGAGVGVILLGALMHGESAGAYSSYDAAIISCDMANNHLGCKPSSSITAKEKNARTDQVIAFTGYGLGLATVAVGAYLLYVDRPIAVEQNGPKPGDVSIVPSVGPGGANVSLSVRF